MNQHSSVKFERNSKKIISHFVIVFLLSLMFMPQLNAAIIYIDKDATGTADGTSWENAYTSIVTGYNAANGGDEVWVAEGLYKLSSTGDRNVHISLYPDIRLYGGFNGTETSLNERKWWKYETIISGDLSENDNGTIDTYNTRRSDNSYNVLYSGYSWGTSYVDGLTIKGGNGRNASSGQKYTYYGGGICVYYGHTMIKNCIIKENAAIVTGGLYAHEAEVYIENCVFQRNYSENSGAAVNAYSTPIKIKNCTFYGNDMNPGMSPKYGVKIYYCTGYSIYNNILYNNCGTDLYITGGSGSSNNNMTSNPYFVNASAGNFFLTDSSAAINAGNIIALSYDSYDADMDGNTSERYPYDLGGMKRYVAGGYDMTNVSTVDIGAYEFSYGRIALNGIDDNTNVLGTISTLSWEYPVSIFGDQESYEILVSENSDYSSPLSNHNGHFYLSSQERSILMSELEPGNTYYIKLKIYGSIQTGDWLESQFTVNGLPSIVLSNPEDNELVSSQDVKFMVGDAADPQGDAMSYMLNIFRDSLLTDTLVSAAMTLEGDTASLIYTLPTENASYYWNVEYADPYNDDISETLSFTFKSANIAKIKLVDIDDDNHVTEHMPTVNWYLSTNSNVQEAYHVQVSTHDDFSDINIWDSGYITTDTMSFTYNGPALADGKDYYLRIRVISTLGISDWESVSFHMNSVPQAEIITPKNDMIISSLPLDLVAKDLSDIEGDSLYYQFSLFKTRSDQLSPSYSEPELINNSKWISEKTWSYLGGLSENASYMWTLQVNDSYENSSIDTGYFHYNTINETPYGSYPVYPKNMAVVDTNTLVMTWRKSLDPDPLDKLNYVVHLKYIDHSGDSPELKEMMFETDTDTSLILRVEDYKEKFYLNDQENYFWNVETIDEAGESTFMSSSYLSFSINLQNDRPEGLKKIWPEDESMITELEPTLVWHPASDLDGDSISYSVHLGTDPNFMKVLDPVYTNYVTLKVEEDSIYYWKVVAADPLGAMIETDTSVFYVNSENNAPGKFKKTFPLPEMRLDSLKAIFTWTPAIEKDPYDKVIYSLLMGSTVEAIEVVNVGIDTTYACKVPDNSIIYWSVSATDKSGASTPCSDIITWFVTDSLNDAPKAAMLITPDSSVVMSKTTRFAWTDATDPDPLDKVSYAMIYGETDTLFTTETICEIDSLKENAKFSWYVLGSDLAGLSSASDTAVFWVDVVPEAPSGVRTSFPADGFHQDETTVQFTWNKAIDPDPFDRVAYSLLITSDTVNSAAYTRLEGIADTSTEQSMPEAGTYYWKVLAQDQDGFIVGSIWSAVTVGQTAISETDIPAEFALHANYPNPFNPSTTIDYDISENTFVSLNVFNMKGQLVGRLINEDMTPGSYSLTWDAADLGTGVYIFRLQAGDFMQIRKALLIK